MTQLETLLVRIERAWVDENDPSLVDRLAEEYPEYKTQLYDFFDFLILDDVPGPALVSEEKVQKLLESRGLLPPQSWVQYLQQETRLSLREIAEKIPRARMEFLVMVGRLPQLVPPKVKETLAERLRETLGLNPADTWFLLSEPPVLRMAASQGKEKLPEPKTFEELLRHTGLTKKDREYWLKMEGQADA